MKELTIEFMFLFSVIAAFVVVAPTIGITIGRITRQSRRYPRYMINYDDELQNQDIFEVQDLPSQILTYTDEQDWQYPQQPRMYRQRRRR